MTYTNELALFAVGAAIVFTAEALWWGFAILAICVVAEYRTSDPYGSAFMRPRILDADNGRELWRVVDCSHHCGISEVTWCSCARKHMPPSGVNQLDARTRLWVAKEGKSWQAGRPSRR